MDDPLPQVTACHCSPPVSGHIWFWCDPHQCRKNAEMQRSCAVNPAAHAAWNAGRGPGQRPAVSSGIEAVPADPPHPPVTWSRKSLIHFAQALVKHARDWFRKCSRREIQNRLEICHTCDQFTGTACAQCGCRVNLEKRFRNKLAWRSEQCPLEKWPALTRQTKNKSVVMSPAYFKNDYK